MHARHTRTRVQLKYPRRAYAKGRPSDDDVCICEIHTGVHNAAAAVAAATTTAKQVNGGCFALTFTHGGSVRATSAATAATAAAATPTTATTTDALLMGHLWASYKPAPHVCQSSV